MKKLSTVMILVAAFIAALVLSGCNNTKTEYVEVGEVEVVEQNISLDCGVPITFTATGSNEDTNVSVEYGIHRDLFVNEFGVDVTISAGYKCPVEEPTEVEPEDGICPAGWEFANDCATVCTPIVEVCLTESLCGEGTILDDNNTCQVDTSPDTGICGDGTMLVDDVCEVID